MRAIYNSLWFPALPFALLAAGGANSDHRKQRLGMISGPPEAFRDGRLRIWLHAASVGEIEAARPIAIKLVESRPQFEFYVTAMTLAGCDAARRRIPNIRFAQLAPLDFPPALRRFLDCVRPHMVLIAETEIWPNYFLESTRRGARLAIINGRLTERALRRYRWARPLFAAALSRASIVLAQTADDADRFVSLGVGRENIAVAGNTKFDSDSTHATLRPELAPFVQGRPLLVAGSTAPGEEGLILEAFIKLRREFSELVLAVAPRHPQRYGEVGRLLAASGLPVAQASRADAAAEPILLVDTIGELPALYRYAMIAFVGGSLVAGRGGQSLAEPAAAAVPVLFGPYHEKQRDLAQALLSHRGALVVENAQQLVSACRTLLANEERRQAMGQRAREVIASRAGAAARSLPHLLALSGVT